MRNGTSVALRLRQRRGRYGSHISLGDVPMTALRRVDPAPTPGRMARVMSRIGTTRVARVVSRHLGWKLDPVLLRLTRQSGRHDVVIPTAVLETRGARSGKRRRNAVIYFHDDDRVVIAASNAGADRHPDWYHNVLAGSDVTFAAHQCRRASSTMPSNRSACGHWLIGSSQASPCTAATPLPPAGGSRSSRSPRAEPAMTAPFDPTPLSQLRVRSGVLLRDRTGEVLPAETIHLRFSPALDLPAGSRRFL